MRKLLIVTLIALGIVVLGLASQFHSDIEAAKLQAKYANAASKFLRMIGMSVHYRDEGAGPALVLLHGTASSLHTWDGWTRELSASFRLVRMDLPGFGLTGPNAANDYGIAQYVSFLAAFADSLQLERFHLAGNSLGGEIAWHFALAYPQRVQSMILLDAAGYPRTDMPFAIQLARNPLTKTFTRWITPRSLVEKSVLEVYGDDGKVTEELVQRYFELTLRAGNRAAFIARANALHEVEPERIKQITARTLIQWGAEDLWIPVEDAHRFAADIPGSELIVYEGAGHVPMEEIPERTARDAKTFLEAQLRLDRGLSTATFMPRGHPTRSTK
jgi:pimeloyl-ACP methyl ester carboxylesterase